MSSIETAIAVVMIIAYSIGRQLIGEQLRVKRLIGLPLALTILGVIEVATSRVPGPTRSDIVLIGSGCAINAAIGICQGTLMRLEARNGFLWGQMPKSVLWWWAAKIASGLVLDWIAHALGAQLATISAVMLLGLGVNRLAQGATVSSRALASSIPFAPESGRLGPGPSEFQHSGELGSAAPPRPGPPSSSPTSEISPDSKKRAEPISEGVPAPSTCAPINLLHHVSQMLLGEINERFSDALK